MPDSRKLGQEICALANQQNGGVILVGVDNAGNGKGIPRDELDKSQLTLVNVVQTTCLPPPKFETRVFDAPDNQARCILVVRIFELPRKPCVTNEKVYVRVGSSARPAGPDEIRRLVLGSAV